MSPPGALVLAALMALGTPSPAKALTLFGLVDTGELFASNDAGATWAIRSTLPVRDAVALVAGSTSSKLFLASGSGSLYRSDDAGTSWSAIGTVTAPDVTAMVGYSGHVMLLTRSGGVYSSTDEGASFTAVGTITAPDVVSATRHDGAIFALTRSGGVHRSADHGATWTTVGALAVPDAVEIASFGGGLFVLTATGDLARSDDLGASWSFVSTLSQVGMTTMLASNTELVASSAGGETAATANGTSWNWRGVIGQLAVGALASDIPTVTGVGGPEPPRASTLLAPWPNPASGSASLALELARESEGNVTVHDLSGRKVAEPVPTQRLAAGRRVTTWSPRGLTPGLYVVRAVVEGRAERRRLVWLGGAGE